MGDPYTTIASQSMATVESLAKTLELRAEEEQQENIRRKILDNIVHGRVLEVGCGTGAVCRHVATLPRVTQVTGIDPSPYFIEIAKTKEECSKLIYCLGSGADIPLEDAGFDVVIIWTTLLHVTREDLPKVLGEALRVLVKDGKLIVFDNDPIGWKIASSPHDLMQVVIDHFSSSWGVDSFLMRKLPGLLNTVGFSQVSPLDLHTIVDTSQTSYGFKFCQRALAVYEGAGLVGREVIAALKQELVRRVEEATFQFVLSYGSIVATK